MACTWAAIAALACALTATAAEEPCPACEAGGRAWDEGSLLQVSKALALAKGSRTDSSTDMLPAGPGPAATRRTVAVNKRVDMKLKSGQQLRLTSAVPVFANASDSYIALIFEFQQEVWQAVTARQFRCDDSKHGKISVPIEWFGGETPQAYPLNIVGRCRWPSAEKRKKCHSLSLVEEGFGSVGVVEACHDPGLASEGPFRLASCGKKWSDSKTHPESAASLLLPPWAEYNLMHGVEHFFWYTDNETQPAVYAALEPYFERGVATRIHSDYFHPSYPQTGDWMGLNDCLYRTIHRADWMMPTIDPDEFLRPFPDTLNDTIRSFPEVFDALAANHTNVTDISFQGFRFLKPDDPKKILVTSPLREAGLQPKCAKYVARPWAMRTLFTHWPISRLEGAQSLGVPAEILSFNHYRTKDRTLMNTTDEGLMPLAEPLYQRLQESFQKQWHDEAKELLDSSTSLLMIEASSEDSPEGIHHAPLVLEFARLFSSDGLKAPRIIDLPSDQLRQRSDKGSGTHGAR